MARSGRSTDSIYTDPQLRARLKDEIQAGDRGGRPGQWSARKAQLLVHEYERAGGGYTDEGTRTGPQQHLEQWGAQDWHTAGGDAQADDGDEMSRYLPDVAWKLLSRAERAATDTRKKKGDAQHIANTAAAQEARRAAELLALSAADARRVVAQMDTASQLRRAQTAEAEHGKARKTVLSAIERRLAAVQRSRA